MHGRFLLKINRVKVQQLQKVLSKKQRKPDKIWSDRGKEFYIKRFYTIKTSKTFKFIQLIQI